MIVFLESQEIYFHLPFFPDTGVAFQIITLGLVLGKVKETMEGSI